MNEELRYASLTLTPMNNEYIERFPLTSKKESDKELSRDL